MGPAEHLHTVLDGWRVVLKVEVRDDAQRHAASRRGKTRCQIKLCTDPFQAWRHEIEAASSNLFVSGWRPAVGWVGVAGLAYQFLGYPLMQWAWAFGQGVDLIPQGLSAPPDLEVEQLMTLLAGLLGFGGMRSLEKYRGVAAK
jgi:hypothetical protein